MPTAVTFRSLAVFAALCCLVAPAAGAVSIEKKGAVLHVKADAYEAEVAADGCLTNLRVAGQEFFAPGIGFSRGTYFFSGGPLQLPDVQRPADGVITARSDAASIKYEFAPDSLTWTVTNATANPMQFLIVFDPDMKAVMSESGQFAKTPVSENWTTASFFRGDAKLTITGGTKVWGPWEAGTECWEASLNGGETRKVVLTVAKASEAEARLAADAAAGKVVQPDLTLLAPLDYQVVQRGRGNQGLVPVSGRVRAECDAVEARLTGKSTGGELPADQWHAVPLDPATRGFHAELPTPAGGWYKLEIRATKAGKPVAESTVGHVGVGEVFVIAGQSNSTNSGEQRTNQESGMVSSFSGSSWQIANDPQPGTHDNSGGGSPWPAFGDAMYSKYKVPIGIASTGHGGTSTNAWQPGGEGTLFHWMTDRMNQLGRGGFRAVLWHQGESDVGMSSDEYAQKLSNVIFASKRAAGWEFPWFVAQVSYHNPNATKFETTRAAQKRLWDEGVALEGPDTDTLGGDNRDGGGAGIHFSPKGLKAHGTMWAEKVGVYLDKVLAERGTGK